MKLYLTALSILVLMLAACREEPALVRQRHEVDLVQSLRSALLESVEAEKSAVLATTDEESQAFATEARNYAAEINRLRGKLRQLITIDRRPEEIKRLDAFDAAWRNVEDVDKRLLALAVANTNLKATRLSVRDGAAALDRFVDALLDLERASSDPSTIRALSLASISALRVQSLLAAHIASPSNEEMTALESRIGGLSDEVERILGAIREPYPTTREQLATAVQEWNNYRQIVTKVLQLSRENTNVLSFDVSIHEKRRVTEDCLSALARLLTAVESGSHATR